MFNFEISAKILTYLNFKKKYFENARNLIKSVPTLFNNDISNIKATKKIVITYHGSTIVIQ